MAVRIIYPPLMNFAFFFMCCRQPSMLERSMFQRLIATVVQFTRYIQYFIFFSLVVRYKKYWKYSALNDMKLLIQLHKNRTL
jgi:hypothetical protein